MVAGSTGYLAGGSGGGGGLFGGMISGGGASLAGGTAPANSGSGGGGGATNYTGGNHYAGSGGGGGGYIDAIVSPLTATYAYSVGTGGAGGSAGTGGFAGGGAGSGYIEVIEYYGTTATAAGILPADSILNGTYYGAVTVTGNATIGSSVTINGSLTILGSLKNLGGYAVTIKGDLLVMSGIKFNSAVLSPLEVFGDLIAYGPLTDAVSYDYGPPLFGANFDASFGGNLFAGGVRLNHTVEIIAGPGLGYVSTIVQMYWTGGDVSTLNFADDTLEGDLSTSTFRFTGPDGTSFQMKPTTTPSTIKVHGSIYADTFDAGPFPINAASGCSLTVDGSISPINAQQDNFFNTGGMKTGSGGAVSVRGSVNGVHLWTNGGSIYSGNSSAGSGGTIRIGSFTSFINGTDYSSELLMFGGLQTVSAASAGAGGNGGLLRVEGSLSSYNISSDGGSTVNGGAGGDGGFIVVGESVNCIIGLQCNGGASSGGAGGGGDGGGFRIGGDVRCGLNGNGNLSAYGGQGNDNGNGGGGGGVTVRGTVRAGVYVAGGGTNCSSGTPGIPGAGGGVTIGGQMLENSYIFASGGSAFGGSGARAGAASGFITFNGGSVTSIDANGGNATTTGAGGIGGQIIVNGHVSCSGLFRSKGGDSPSGTAGHGGQISIKAGGVFQTLRLRDGTGTAPVVTTYLELSGHVSVKTLDVISRAGVTIRGESLLGPAMLSVGSFTSKNQLTNAGNTNTTGALSATGTIHFYDNGSARWYELSGLLV